MGSAYGEAGKLRLSLHIRTTSKCAMDGSDEYDDWTKVVLRGVKAAKTSSSKASTFVHKLQECAV